MPIGGLKSVENVIKNAKKMAKTRFGESHVQGIASTAQEGPIAEQFPRKFDKGAYRIFLQLLSILPLPNRL
jgi:hypothetical protein